MIKASIVIPSRDKLSRLKLVLQALAPQVDATIEVLIIFDGCSAETLRLFDEMDFSVNPKKIIHSKSLGAAAARNSGIREASGEIIIFLDDDRIPAPGFINRHINWHKAGRYALIGCRYNVFFPEEKLDYFYRNKISSTDFNQISSAAKHVKFYFVRRLCRLFLGKVIDRVTFTTGNSSVKRADLFTAGLFDEKFIFSGMEDVDLGYRLAGAGVKIVRDYSISNYHLSHTRSDPHAYRKIYRQNVIYFLEKIKKDKISSALVKILNLVYFLAES